MANVPPQGGRKHPHQEFLQIDTRNILFICGGAFDGLEEIVSRRIAYSGSQMGFLSGSRYRTAAGGSSLNYVTPEDLLEFGFIPEMVGRLPVVTCLEPLDRDALIRVLVEPKNAIVKQYQRLFSYDNVRLNFTQEALEAAAEKALAHQTGARCLRYVVEEALMEVMYELPSLENVVECVVDQDAIEGVTSPELITDRGERFRLPGEPEMQKSA